MLERRQFLLAAGALLAARLARAQAPQRMRVLGVLTPHPKATHPQSGELKRRGWIEGETLRTEWPDAGGREERLAELAAELVEKKVDVIWANGPDAALAAARATRTIPIVFWGVLYPVEQGLVDSYARPGRNVTGVAVTASAESDTKRLEFLRELAPAARRIAFLAAPSSFRTAEGSALHPKIMTDTARVLGLDLREFIVEKSDGLPGAFGAIREWGAQALVTQPSTLFFRERERIIAFANENRLPSAFTLWDYAASGGLLAYAIDWRPTVARSFEYVDQILRGAKPADLPVYLPDKYELAINLKTAKLLGLKVPPALLVRADRVFE